MLCAFLAVCLLRFAPIVLCSGRWGIFLCEAQKKSQHHGRGKPLPPLLRFVCGAANRELSRYGRRPRRPVGRPPYASPAKRSSLPGLLQPCRGRACPARGLTESARLRETTPGGYRIRPYGKSLPPPTAANRGRTSRKPIFQQQPPPVVENFPGGRRFIARK